MFSVNYCLFCRAKMSATQAQAAPSVCLFVCLSVCHKPVSMTTNAHKITRFSSLRIAQEDSSLLIPTSITQVPGELLNLRRLQTVYYGKNVQCSTSRPSDWCAAQLLLDIMNIIYIFIRSERATRKKTNNKKQQKTNINRADRH